MSEGNVPPRPQDADSLPDAQGQLPLEPVHPPTGNDDWEIVPLVGMPPLSSPDPGEPSSALPPLGKSKEAELQCRIVDLNHCNEVLLARVHQLEDALERSQQALQQEVERSQRRPAEDKIAAAQTQSVAQLLSELDAANAALKRQTLLAETLATQLKSAEERAERLEKECAILRKRKSERAKQLQTAEETCTDLRSRLQRQQQYTLQFKAALEKCLDTSAFQHTSQSIEKDAVPTPGAIASASVTPSPSIGMPRSASIRPWSANPTQSPADPQLQSLLRSQPTPSEPAPPGGSESSHDAHSAATGSEPRPVADATAAPASPNAATDQPHHEAEQQLWQDVERVVKNTTTPPAAPAPSEAPPTPEQGARTPTPTAADTTPPPASAETAEFTEPIPWGAPIKTEPPAMADAPASDAPASVEPATTFPEPAPATTADAEPVTPPPAQSSPPVPPTPAYAASIPALDAMQTAQKSPSPLVHPLRPPQRKRKSLSAVELPSFPPLPKVQNH